MSASASRWHASASRSTAPACFAFAFAGAAPEAVAVGGGVAAAAADPDAARAESPSNALSETCGAEEAEGGVAVAASGRGEPRTDDVGAFSRFAAPSGREPAPPLGEPSATKDILRGDRPLLLLSSAAWPGGAGAGIARAFWASRAGFPGGATPAVPAASSMNWLSDTEVSTAEPSPRAGPGADAVPPRVAATMSVA